MRQGSLDGMVAFAVAELASDDLDRVNKLVHRLASRWPGEPALAICFALTSAAHALDSQFSQQDHVTTRAYMLSSLLAADIFALESMGQHPAKGHHLLGFWRRVDPYFIQI